MRQRPIPRTKHDGRLGAAVVTSCNCTRVSQQDQLDPPPRSDGPNRSRPTVPLQRNRPRPRARGSSRGDYAPLPSASWGPSRRGGAAAGYSGRVALSFSVIVLRKERLRAIASYEDLIPDPNPPEG